MTKWIVFICVAFLRCQQSDMAQLMNIRLGRHDAQPWGFRLQGGKDFGTPLVVQKVNGGSIAEQAGLIPGDAVIKINNVDVFNLRHKDAQDVIVRSGNTFDITIQRGGSTWRPQVTPVGQIPAAGYGNSIPTVTKTSLAHKPQEVRHIGSGYNSSARPFSSVNGSDGQVKSIVNKQYNTPVGIYSEEAIAETLSAQAEVLAGGVLGVNFKKNEKVYNSANSEVYKFLHEQEDHGEPDPRAPQNFFWTASHAIGGRKSPKSQTAAPSGPEEGRTATPQQQQQQQSGALSPGSQHRPSVPFRHPQAGAEPPAPTEDDTPKSAGESAVPPKPAGESSGAGVTTCDGCGVSIVGVFVRIKDKNLHVDCFKCATCGSSLKNQGYYNFNNKLYCDIHAKLAAMNNPPAGTEGYVPVPIKPNTKLSASTISAAINAHHHQSNGTSHLIGSPTSNDQATTPFQPSHSRTSSSSSSVGTTNSCISSLSPNISSTPEKLSPVHSRQSSGSGSLVGGAGAGPQQFKGISVPPVVFGTMSATGEPIIYHKQNENDMNSNNRNMTTNGMPGGTGTGMGPGAPQTGAYNQFLKEYSNKKCNDTVNGSGNKSSPGDTNGSNSAANVTLTGAPGHGHQEATATESLYGSIRADTKIQPHDEFQYVTLDGSIIKSVIPPGKGIKTNYKVNQGYGGPKPFNVSPKTPPISGPKSPSAYPPPSQAPSWAQPKPAVNPYATLPRSTGPSQEENFEQSCEYHEQEEHHFEDLEVSQATQASSTVSNVIWPPPLEDYRLTPTATPLYIAPPETQHVKPKYIEKVEQRESSQQAEQQHTIQQETRHETKTTKSVEERSEVQRHEMHMYQQQQYDQQQYQQQQAVQWQSRSAPELTVGKQQVDVESSSDSYTSTCTTTTTTSEEYQRMYQAQVQAYQMQQMYEQSGSEMDYHMDMEVAAMQQQQEQSYSTSSEFLSAHSGRRSAQECAETIKGPVSTYKLIDLVREVTPSPTPPAGKGPRKVEFKEAIEEKEEKVEKVDKTEKKESELKTQKKTVKIKEEENEEKVLEVVYEDVEIERKFKPAPEIKIEIPEAKPVPPTNIPNPVPKEWISPMQKALTTAPDKPVTLGDICSTCPCEQPCKPDKCKCKKEAEILQKTQKEEKQKEEKEEKRREEKEKRTEEKAHKEHSVQEKSTVLTETPPKGTFITKVVSTAPTDPIQFVPKSNEPVPLPEETEPYMPPPIDMKPYVREDFRPKSPMLRALMTAPEQPFSPLGEGVASQLDDLPRPRGRLTMVDALTVAPDRSYSPLSPDNILGFTEKKEDHTATSYKRDSLKEQNIQKFVDVSTKENEIQTSSAFASFSGQSSISSFQPRLEPITFIPGQSSVQTTSISDQAQDAHYTKYSSHTTSLAQKHQQSMSQSSTKQASSYQSMKQSQTQMSSTSHTQQTTCSKTESHKQTTCAKTDCHKQQSQEKTQLVSFPPEPGMPAKKAVLSGLHKPESIPQYQRNWTVLPSQRPVRTPEPQELKENVPLAFVEVPTEQSQNVDKPQAVKTPASASSSAPSSAGAAVSNATRSSETKPKIQSQTAVPIIIEDRSGPITMTFQSIDDQSEQQHEDHSYAHPRPFTPSLINKAPPIVPFYQTPEKLVFEECSATTSQPFDRRSVSPLPDRAKSPAQGPPPNPLSAIRAPRIKDDDLVLARTPQVGSITTGQPYSGGHLMQQQQGQVLSHYQTVSQAGSQSFVDKPEVIQQSRFGDMQIQKREKESQLSEEQQSKMESKTTTQIGNTQIERRRKVVEEFEHTQKAKTIEIRKSSGGTTQQTHQYGKTGFVANQTSRLSGLEKEISSLTSQAQAISARAATLGQSESPKFPQYKSPEPVSKFPFSTPLHSYGELEKQEPLVSGSSVHQHASQSGGLQEIQSAAAASSSYAASSLSQSSASHSFLGSSNISAGSSSSYNTSAIPVPAFKPPLTSAGGTDKSALASGTNTYKPTPSTGPAGFKPPPPMQPSNKDPSSSNVSDPSPASTGGAAPGAGKGGAFGATSAPKRGRGILNKAVGPGARIPLCGCCNTQVRINDIKICKPLAFDRAKKKIENVKHMDENYDTNIPVPPPPPLPAQSTKTNGFTLPSSKRVNGEGGQKLGKATEMLASSLERLDINSKDSFKVEAGKILSSMLEARLSGKTSPRPPPPPPPADVPSHPMKNVIDICDGSLPNKTNPLPLHIDTVKQTPDKHTVDPVITQLKDGDSPAKVPTNGKIQELEPLETVIYRNKSTNPNTKRELTSHALDRRSYIEKDQQNVEVDSNPEIVVKAENDVQPEQIANELRDGKHPICFQCNAPITRGPFITALGRIWCPEHFMCVNANCRRPLQDIGFVEEKGDLYCEYCFEKYLAPSCSKCSAKIKGDCLNAIGKHFHPECFTCAYCGKLFGNSPFFLEEGEPYCEADWNELFTTKCFACGFPVEAGDRWVEALNHNYHSQCFNCTMCKKNLEGQSFYNKGGRPFCKNHAR